VARVVLGVGGGIAAYKSCELVRRLREAGHRVRVVPTAAALRFVGAPTWEALSGEPVSTEVWDDITDVPHVRLGREADLVLVAPATADLLARAAAGLADDQLTTTLLTARCPVVMAPAMHTEMWEHPATRANVATLRARGTLVVDPAVGRLTGADSGAGRLPEPADLAELARDVQDRGARARDLAGRSVVVSAGGTREPLDPVRFLGNRSSGRQGVALAATAVARGARVTLVAAHLAVPAPAGVTVVPVGTAAELAAAVLPLAETADAVVMAAAVADFRPVAAADAKIKKTGSGVPEVRLEQTTDVLAALVRQRRPGQVIVGFAAETGDAEGDARMHGRAKLARKGADLLVVNEVGPPGHPTGFEGTDNAAVLLGRDGSETDVPHGTKEALADRVWDAVLGLWPAGEGRAAPAAPVE
jgi:phosphopantothenoylcysteine decarboxylase/phosphopantothenate--cysteine ligase